MALAPADFYAYSRATGAPVPEDPEERARMAPEVLEFRRNQLQSPQEGPNIPGILGAAALGVGALAGGIAGARALGRRRAVASQQAAPVLTREGLQAVDTIGKQRQAEQTIRQARQERPAGTVLTDLPTAAQAMGALESGEDQMTGRVRQQLQRNEDLDLASIDQSEDLEKQAQYLTFKQQPGDDSAINVAASMTPDGLPVDQAEGQTSASRFLQSERQRISQDLAEQNILPTPSRIEGELSRRLGSEASSYGPKYSARRQALELYAQTGDPKLLSNIQQFGLSPVSFETFETMPAAQRVGFEQAPPFTTSYYPKEELTAEGLSSNIRINVPARGEVSIAELRKPVITEDTALAAEAYLQEKKGEALDWLGNLRVQLEPKRNKILKERQMLAEQRANEILPQIELARSTNQFNLAQDLEGQLQNLRTVWKNPELGTHREDELRLLNAQISGAQKKIEESISGIEKKYPTTLSNWSGETERVFGELDVNTGEFIPETMELRADRRAVDLGPKGGGGRNIAEYTAGERMDEEIRAIQGGGRIRDYDPETGAAAQQWLGDRTQTGREIGIYGIQPSTEKPPSASMRPSQPSYTKEEIVDEAMRLASSDPYGDVPIAPDYDAAIESLGSQPKTEASRRSVLMSEAVRKAQRLASARNPRGGVLPDEITTLRRQMETIQPAGLGSATSAPPGTIPPEQLGLQGVTGYAARQRKSPADVAAEQLESYMSKLQRGRSTPLTSQAVIQPRLF